MTARKLVKQMGDEWERTTLACLLVAGMVVLGMCFLKVSAMFAPDPGLPGGDYRLADRFGDNAFSFLKPLDGVIEIPNNSAFYSTYYPPRKPQIIKPVPETKPQPELIPTPAPPEPDNEPDPIVMAPQKPAPAIKPPTSRGPEPRHFLQYNGYMKSTSAKTRALLIYEFDDGSGKQLARKPYYVAEGLKVRGCKVKGFDQDAIHLELGNGEAQTVRVGEKVEFTP